MAVPRLKVEYIADVAVIKFLDRRILDDPTIQAIADQLFGLVDNENQRKLLLNFEGVDYMSSAALGKLINLHKKLTALKGKVAMCNLIPQIVEVFTITKLDRMFKIFPNEEAALDGFR
jgi:anti-sigma B factor antagonist